MLDLTCHQCLPKDIFDTLSHICDGAFCETKFAKSSILDILQGFEHAFVISIDSDFLGLPGVQI